MSIGRVVRACLAIAALGAAVASARPAEAEPPAPRIAAARAAAVGEDASPHVPSVDERLEVIRQRIQAALYYPPLARKLELTGIAWLRFSIDGRGAAREVELARSSGHRILDQAARRTLDRAGRLPWVYGRIEVPVRFALDDPT
jgi:protein TonB